MAPPGQASKRAADEGLVSLGRTVTALAGAVKTLQISRRGDAERLLRIEQEVLELRGQIQSSGSPAGSRVESRVSTLERTVSTLVAEMRARGVIPKLAPVRSRAKVTMSDEARLAMQQQKAERMRASRWPKAPVAKPAAPEPVAAKTVPKKKRKKRRPA